MGTSCAVERRQLPPGDSTVLPTVTDGSTDSVKLFGRIAISRFSLGTLPEVGGCRELSFLAAKKLRTM
jgi:hypothetical protein